VFNTPDSVAILSLLRVARLAVDPDPIEETVGIGSAILWLNHQ
jgi:hypothetical protein